MNKLQVLDIPEHDRYAIVSPQGGWELLVKRLIAAFPKAQLSTHLDPAEVPDGVYVIGISPNGDPTEWWDRVANNAILLSQQQADGLTDPQQSLQSSDWFILRDLERMFLKDHPLHQQREQWREQVDKEIAAETEPNDEQ